MGSHSYNESKLSLFSLPNKSKQTTAATTTTTAITAATPPVGTLASVPFQWEEAPGKPRRISCNVGPKSKTVRCLDLPPRLLNEAAATNNSNGNIIPSPTTVLDGPYNLDNNRSLSMPRSRSLSSTASFGGRGGGLFGSGRWKSKDIGVVDFSSDDSKVKIVRFTRKSSFYAFSSSTSYFFTNIYESFKQVVPWRRRQRSSEK